MTRRLRSVCLLYVFLLASGAALCGADTATPHVIDVMPDFWRFWEEAQGKPVADQVKLFRETVVSKYPGLFGKGVIQLGGVPDPERDRALDERLAKYMAELPPQIPAMRKLSNQLGRSLQEYARGFQQEFPDYAAHTPIYFTLSLWQFDGATREVDGKTVLLFGVDEIARFHGADTDLKVLFDHELFHQYHGQVAPEFDADGAPLWMSLWEEGLATYVSRHMNPGASTQDALMFPHDLEERARPMLPQLARELLENMDSTSKDEYAAFFFWPQQASRPAPAQRLLRGLPGGAAPCRQPAVGRSRPLARPRTESAGHGRTARVRSGQVADRQPDLRLAYDPRPATREHKERGLLRPRSLLAGSPGLQAGWTEGPKITR